MAACADRIHFVDLVNDGKLVDTTLMIRDILAFPDKVFLFTRPGNYGKTVNMDMLRLFLEKSECDRSMYFRNLNIYKAGESMKVEVWKYPVEFLSFKNLCSDSMASFQDFFSELIVSEYLRHSELKDSPYLMDVDKRYYMKALNRELSRDELRYGIRNLSQMLYLHHKKQCFIMIDDYDVPLTVSLEDEVTRYLRSCLSNAFNRNEALAKGILAGTYNMNMNGLCNLREYSLFDSCFSEYFVPYKNDDFSEGNIECIREVLANPEVQKDVESLVDGKTVITFIDRYLTDSEWSSQLYYQLVAGGYLKVDNIRICTNDTRLLVDVSLPNKSMIA